MSEAPRRIETVAVIGLGDMGSALARALLEGGRGLVVYNRTPAKARALSAWASERSVAYLAGDILNTASMAGVMGEMGWAPYVASKAAVIGLTKTAAIELGPRGIRVNCVCPSTIQDEGGADWGELADLEAKLVPFFHQIGRLGKPEEVAALFHFLASDEAAFLSGLAIPIDGGLSAGVSLGVIEPLVGYLESQK